MGREGIPMEWRTVLGGWELYRNGRLVANVYAQFTMDGAPYFIWGARGPDGKEASGWERTPEQARQQAEAVVRGEKV